MPGPGLTRLLPLLVLAVGLISSAGIASLVHETHRNERRAEFELLVERVADAVQRQLASPAVALRALQGVMRAGQGEADTALHATYAEHLVRAGDFHGLSAIGLAQGVEAAGTVGTAGVSAATSVASAGLSTTLRMRWLSGNATADATLPVAGAVLPSEPALNAAIERARREGAPALAGLRAHGAAAQRTLWMVMPTGGGSGSSSDTDSGSGSGKLFNAAPPRQHSDGLLVAIIDTRRALGTVVNAAERRIDFELFDGADARLGALVYDDDEHLTGHREVGPEDVADRSFADLRTLQVAGRTLSLRSSSTARFDQHHGSRHPAWWVMACGSVLSLLAAALVHQLNLGRQHARRLSHAMTADLERLAEVVRHTTHAVVIIDKQRGIQWANPTFERLARRPLAQMQGLPLRELGILARGQRDAVQGMVQAQDEGRAHHFELGLIDADSGIDGRTDSHTRWLDVDMQPRLDEAGHVNGFVIVGSDITAKRAALQSLAHERAQMQALIAGANCGVLLWHLPSDALQLDRRMAQLLGCDADTLAHMTRRAWGALVHPADVEESTQVTRELITGQRVEVVQELRVRHQQGHWVWMQVRASIIERQASGRAVWLSAIYLDITERKRADQRWQLRGQLSSDWYWETDAQHSMQGVDGGLADTMPAAAPRYLGLRRDKIAWLEPPEGGWDAFHAMLDRHEAFRGVVYRSHAPGIDAWVEVDGQPRFDDDGRFIGYAGVGRAITERLAATLQLRESLAVLDAVFSSMNVPVLMKDRDGVLRRVNPAYAHTVGLSVEQVIGLRAADIFDTQVAARHETEDAEIMRTALPRSYESRQPMGDGRVLDTLVYKAPVIDTAGRVLGIVGSVIDVTERREAERALERERARLADIIAGASAGIAEWALASGEMALDERFALMLGLRWPEQVPRHVQQWRARVHEADLPQLDEAVRAHLRGHTEFVAVDQRMRHADGRWLWVHVRGRVTARDEMGRAQRITGAHFDVTERRQTAERWRARAELSGDWFWQTDTDHRFIDMVSGDSYGWLTRAKDVAGRRRDEMTWIDPPEMGWAAFHTMLDRHESFKGVMYCNRTIADDPRWIEIDGRPRWDDGGRFQGYDGVGRDVTERRRVTEQLRQSLAQLGSLIRAVPIPLVMKDRQGRNTAVNRAYCEFYGVTEQQVIGRTVFDFWSPEVAARYDAEDQALMADRRTRRTPVQVRASTGQLLDIVVHKSPIVAPDGEVIGTVGAVVDMSEQHAAARALVEAKEAAESANRAKSAFLATMSHEIRTPMNGVIGMAELLSHTELADDQSRQVQTIVDSARTLLDILDDILDFSKIEAGRLELEQQPLAVAALVESACDTLLPLALAAQVALHVHIDSALPAQVLGDATRLRQIITNLVGNAIKFSAPAVTGEPGPAAMGSRGAGSVSVRLIRDAEQLLLTVQDQGIGIDEATLSRLFVPFSQGEISTTRRFGGTGLGLAIIQRLVDMMRGRIEVRSQLGLGSCFRVWLPLAAAHLVHAVPASSAVAAAALPQLHGVRCALVDDGELALADLRSWLCEAGAEVRVIEPAAALPQDAIVLRWQTSAPAASWHATRESPRQPRAAEVAEVADLAEAADMGAATSAQLLLGRGRRTEVRLLGPQLAVLDQPRRGSLQRAVAVLAGLASPSALSAPVSAAGHTALQPSQHLILVAEDDATNRIVIERQLALLGYRAEMAHDGEQALRLWQDGRYAALLTDLHMPGMDGYTLTLEIRAAESRRAGATRRMPIVALTANALKGEALRARAAGIDDYLTKPVPLKLLRSTLEHWLPGEARAAARDAEPAPGDAALLDLAVPMALLGQDESALQELLQDFAAMATARAEDIRQGLAQRDGARAAAAAHRLKSAARAVGALALAQQCEAVERCRSQRDPAVLATVLANFERAFARANEAVAKAKNQPCPSGTASSPSTSIGG